MNYSLAVFAPGKAALPMELFRAPATPAFFSVALPPFTPSIAFLYEEQPHMVTIMKSNHLLALYLHIHLVPYRQCWRYWLHDLLIGRKDVHFSVLRLTPQSLVLHVFLSLLSFLTNCDFLDNIRGQFKLPIQQLINYLQ